MLRYLLWSGSSKKQSEDLFLQAEDLVFIYLFIFNSFPKILKCSWMKGTL